MGLGEGRKVLEENRVPESQVLCLHLEFQPQTQSQKIVPKLVMETLTGVIIFRHVVHKTWLKCLV